MKAIRVPSCTHVAHCAMGPRPAAHATLCRAVQEYNDALLTIMLSSITQGTNAGEWAAMVVSL